MIVPRLFKNSIPVYRPTYPINARFGYMLGKIWSYAFTTHHIIHAINAYCDTSTAKSFFSRFLKKSIPSLGGVVLVSAGDSAGIPGLIPNPVKLKKLKLVSVPALSIGGVQRIGVSHSDPGCTYESYGPGSPQAMICRSTYD